MTFESIRDTESKEDLFRKKSQVEVYMKSKKTENIGVRISKVMSMQIDMALERSGADSVAEYIRLCIANDLSGFTVADRVQDEIGDIIDGLNYTRTKIEDSGETTSEQVLNTVISFAELIGEREKKFLEMMQLRDAEFKQISESMLKLTAFITQQYGDLNGGGIQSNGR